MREGEEHERRPESHRLTSGTALLSALYLVAIAAFLFRRVLTADLIYGDDVLDYFYYSRAYGFGQMRAGEVPLWNPYHFCGYPFAGNAQSALFYPPNMIFLLLDVGRALSLSIFLHVLLAGGGLFLFVWHLTRRASASVLAASIYMLSGFLSTHIFAGHVTICCAYPWLPYVLWALDKALRQRRMRWAMVGGLFLSCSMLAGHPQMAYYTLIACVLYAVAYGWACTGGRSRWLSLGRAARPLGVLVVVGVLLSAIQLVPTGCFAQHSTRLGGLSYEAATTHSFPPEKAVTFLVPFLFGDGLALDGHSAYWGRWHLWSHPYVGVLPLCLTLLAVFSRRRLARLMALLCLLAVFLALGRYAPYFRGLFGLVPGLSLFRAPARALFLFAFAAATASGLMLAGIVSEIEQGVRPKLLAGAWRGLAVLAIVLVMAGLVAGRMKTGEGSFWQGLVRKVTLLEGGEQGKQSHPHFLEQSLRFARRNLLASSLWAALAAGVAWLGRHRRARKLFPAALIALVTADLLWSAERYVRGIEWTEPRLERNIVEVVKPKGTVVPPRIASARSAAALRGAGLDGISHVGGYDPALLNRYADYMNAATDDPGSLWNTSSGPMHPTKLLRLAGISHVILGPDATAYPESSRLLRTKSAQVFALRLPLSRAFVVHRATAVADRSERLKRLLEIDPSEEAIVEEALTLPLAPCPAGASEEVRITKYEPHLVEMSVLAASNALVVLTDTHYPAWEATLNGRSTELLAVDHLFRGVVVPPGEHEIVLTYSKRMFYTGAFITAITLAFVGTVLVFGVVKRRRRTGTAL